MMIIVNISAKSGMYDWLAIEMVKLTKGNPILVLVMLSIFTAVVSAFLDNVTTVILVMPLTFVIAQQFEISPIPFLISEVLASNIGGTATLIGDPPNIIIASRAGLSFMDFIVNLAPVVAVILVVAAVILAMWFKNAIKTKQENIAKIMELDNTNYTFEDFWDDLDQGFQIYYTYMDNRYLIYKVHSNCYREELISTGDKSPHPKFSMVTLKKVKELFEFMSDFEYKIN